MTLNNKQILNLVLIANANEKIGGGHVSRLLILAKEFLKINFKVYLLTDKNSELPYPLPKIEVIRVDSILNFKEIKSNIDFPIDVTILDGYNFSTEFEKSVNSISIVTCIFDDFKNKTHQCDFIINQNLGVTKNDYTYPKSSIVLSGEEYTLFEDQILNEATKSIRNKINTVLVNFGSYDIFQLSKYVVQELMEFEIEIIFAMGHSSPEFLIDFINSLSKQIKFSHKIYPYTDLLSLMQKADIVIGGSGSSIWHRCILGLPSIIISQSDDQVEIAKHLEQNNFALYLNHFNVLQKNSLKNLMSQLKNNNSILENISKKVQTLFDGNGKNRILSKIMNCYSIKKSKYVQKRI
ncbi:MAG: UDP-2,4-diacetamido-2,4,6-trideoxy-beta-L-altropyranose hydrolase [Candidatus Caenarcaniphilales bacterium]|nr:UDP-2,4-diacetamido-2,4,6-trideoxy-beta-L-altropyranose hydrolase [Candidatus Caenarcaniphilales bacterium]